MNHSENFAVSGRTSGSMFPFARRKLLSMRFLALLLFGIVMGSAGCGLQSDKKGTEVGEVTTGAAMDAVESGTTGAIRHQLEILVQNASKWRKSGDDKEETVYTVLDLDHNGRLEVLSGGGYDADDLVSVECYEVNQTGDDVEVIDTDQEKKVFLNNLLSESDAVYYDPETGEYHYVFGNELSGEEMISEECNDYKDMIALTLREGQIFSDTLAYQDQTGKKQPRFYQMTDRNPVEIGVSEYSAEKMGDAAYPECGRATVRFSSFSFDHSLEDTTEEQMYHALEKSYQGCYMGYPLGKRKMTVAGQEISIPQYTAMQDRKKQKRINQMIYDQVTQIVDQVYDPENSESDLQVTIAIKYAGLDRVSLLLQAVWCGNGAAHASSLYDAINIDLEQGKMLSGQDLLPEQDREEAAEEILEEYEDGLDEEDDTEDEVEDYPGNLVRHPEKWQEVTIYQTRDMIGIVIPTGIGTWPYEFHEVCRDGNWYDEEVGVAYAAVDWEAYQYKLFASEYQGLQEYMPVLTGKADFTWNAEMTEDDTENDRKKQMTIGRLAEEFGYGEEDPPLEELILTEICICDLTQDGKPELILSIYGGLHVVLHKEGDRYYGICQGRRSLYDLQNNGVYEAGKYGRSFYQMHFEGEVFVEEFLGGFGYADFLTEDTPIYYIGNQEVGKKAYQKWEKSIQGEEVCWYSPEALYH